MEHELNLRIVLESPTAGVDFGLQKGKGNNYETIQTQRSTGINLAFEFKVKVKTVENTAPVFLGPFVQGNPTDRFIYIDIGKCAGQQNTPWSRRLKIPLVGVTPQMINQSFSDPALKIETVVPGTGKDGGPNCATVKPFNGWK